MGFKKICWLFGIPLFLFAGTVFYLYAHSLGGIAKSDGPWSSFGSLLSGVFTLVGAGATIGTLLFLSKQNQDVQKVTQAQLSAMRFEQYINHRRLFMDRLIELQDIFENKFVFVDGGRLYSKIFPNNGPASLEFTVAPFSNESGENLLGRMGARLTRLEQMLNKSMWSGREPLELTTLLIHLYGDLQIRWIDDPCDGDIKFFGKNTGINIYSIEEFTHRALIIYNSLLFYSGNSQFSGFNRGVTRFVREALMRYFLNNHDNSEALEVVKNIPGLAIMEDLFFLTESLRLPNHDWMMERTFRQLESVFDSRESVLKLDDDLFVSQLVRVGRGEHLASLDTITENDPNYRTLQRCEKYLFDLLDRRSAKY